MKYCARCGNEIKDTKKRYCKYCHLDLANPDNIIDRDIDINIRQVTLDEANKTDVYDEKKDDYVDYELTEDEQRQLNMKQHKKLTAFFLQLFLGFFGAGFFYVGRWIRGILWIVVCILFALLVLVIPWFYVVIFIGISNVVLALFMLLGKSTDANGLELI